MGTVNDATRVLLYELQTWALGVLLCGYFYLCAGYLFRSLHPTGSLSWQARRFRRGETALIFLGLAVGDVKFNVDRHRIGAVLTGVLLTVILLLFAMVVRWWWRDRQREAAARETWFQRGQEEGTLPFTPSRGRARRVWNWLVTVYAAFLVVAGVYAFRALAGGEVSLRSFQGATGRYDSSNYRPTNSGRPSANVTVDPCRANE
jgi:hypothetical protein